MNLEFIKCFEQKKSSKYSYEKRRSKKQQKNKRKKSSTRSQKKTSYVSSNLYSHNFYPANFFFKNHMNNYPNQEGVYEKKDLKMINRNTPHFIHSRRNISKNPFWIKVKFTTRVVKKHNL